MPRIEPSDEMIQSLFAQERTLADQIQRLEAFVEGSDSSTVRAFRNTRLRQLDEQRLALGERLRRLSFDAAPVLEAHRIGSALREAQVAAEGASGL